MNTLSGIGTGFVFTFIPIYLLDLGYMITSVILWLAVAHFTIIIGAFLTVFFSNKIGLVRCWYIRIVLAALLYGGLMLLPAYPWMLLIVAVIGGLEAAFFWIPYNILTVRKTKEASMGSAMAFMSNVGSAAGILTPGIAAIVIVTLGYNYLFYVAIFFILISLIPVLPLRDEKTDFHFKWQKIRQTVKENKHFIVPEILDNLGQDAGIMWSIYLFITALTVLDIGFLGVISGIVGMIVTYIVGRHIDNSDKRKVVRVGAVATTVMWIISYFVILNNPTPALLYLVTTLRGFALGIFTSAYGVIMFNRARRTDAEFIVLREIPTVFGRLIVFSLSILFVSMGRFELAFLLVGIISIYFWFNNLDVLVSDQKGK